MAMLHRHRFRHESCGDQTGRFAGKSDIKKVKVEVKRDSRFAKPSGYVSSEIEWNFGRLADM
jgi:hypothetical protein